MLFGPPGNDHRKVWACRWAGLAIVHLTLQLVAMAITAADNIHHILAIRINSSAVIFMSSILFYPLTYSDLYAANSTGDDPQLLQQTKLIDQHQILHSHSSLKSSEDNALYLHLFTRGWIPHE